MIIWIIIAVLIVCAVVVMVQPLLRRDRNHKPGTAYDLAVYKDQLAELERDLGRNVLNPEQAESGRFEIHQRILNITAQDTDAGTDQLTTGPARPDRWIIVLILIIPLSAVALYLKLGSPEMPDYPLAGRTDVRDAQSDMATAALDMETIIDRLRDRLEQTPDDLEGWQLLSRSLVSVQRFNEAAVTYKKVYEITGDLMDQSNYVEALLMASNSDITPEALSVFEVVVQANPLDARASFYIGMAALQGGDAESALQTWIDLLYLSPVNAPWVASIEDQIRQTARESNINLDTARPSPRAIELAIQAGIGQDQAASGLQNLPGPSAEDMANAQQMSTSERDDMIRSMVQRLADRLAEAPDDPQGWSRLAKAYEVLGETDKASNARRMAEDYSN